MSSPAQILNEQIAASHPQVAELLSDRGRNIAFPHGGILGQTAEAKGKKINATIGIALEDDGSPLCLKCLQELVDLPPDQAFTYAPSFGRPDLRGVWQELIRQKNPGLGQQPISKPVSTIALTHALSVCGYLFLDPGEELILPDFFWGNYKLTFLNTYGATFREYPTFAGDGFNVAGLQEALAAGEPGKKAVLLNFPNNPTGYTPTEAEAKEIADVLVAAAEAGNRLVVFIDDAYFGLVYRDGVFRESMFALLAGAHENLLAVKVDGATKEDYVWGFRVGFITYGVKGATPELYTALEDKTAGTVRGTVSNAPNISQSLLLKAYTSPDYQAQKQEKYQVLRRRVEKIDEILAAHPEYAESFRPLPFNSGYFMCVRLHDAEPEKVRKILLEQHSTGVIAASGVIRLAFSAAPYELLEELFANLHQAVQQARG